MQAAAVCRQCTTLWASTEAQGYWSARGQHSFYLISVVLHVEGMFAPSCSLYIIQHRLITDSELQFSVLNLGAEFEWRKWSHDQ